MATNPVCDSEHHTPERMRARDAAERRSELFDACSAITDAIAERAKTVRYEVDEPALSRILEETFRAGMREARVAAKYHSINRCEARLTGTLAGRPYRCERSSGHKGGHEFGDVYLPAAAPAGTPGKETT